jgi:hypothetical protein
MFQEEIAEGLNERLEELQLADVGRKAKLIRGSLFILFKVSK